MTNNTPAPAPKDAVLTTGQILSLERRSNMTDDEALRFARAIESALLPKLRAPVADERPDEYEHFSDWLKKDGPIEREVTKAEMARHGWMAGMRFADFYPLASAPVAGPIQWPTMPPSKGQSPVLFEDGYAEGWAKCMDECRRAVSAASAPVAGEAQPVAWGTTDGREPISDALKRAHSRYATAYTVPYYAAPQASEADPLQGAADWLMRAFEPPLSASDLARQLVIGYNRATRLRDAALSAQPGAQKNGGSDAG
ncbi:hypothetical protein [Achromobacter sp. ACM05]|uniref:hypothetical protein n=1 Tax=Achromobacter sp. ACM05 TaxID=2854776 RepID=UPI001C45FD7F|nr:hypothetical protein [Achromobacter sp. ACM05]MBV7502054.1 hypothetical protein [Achromobacter sp. ACM05]